MADPEAESFSGSEMGIGDLDESLELSVMQEDEPEQEQGVVTLDGSFHEVGIEPKQNECEICGKTFKRKQSLKRHLGKHSDTAFMCSRCTFSFDSDDKLNDHNKKYHQNRFICDECGSLFSSKPALHSHKMLKHGADDKNKHVCPYPECKKIFVRRTRFEDHVASHLKVKSHKCEKCGKMFTSRYDKTKHTEMCGVPPKQRKCSECEQTFSSYSNLNIHKTAVHETVSYSCECGKSFKYVTGLSRHRKKNNHVAATD